ncbi:MAG: BadF/BadG/BcrA/BcrD ATPase family protein, partial [Planctomycetota bacterium]
MSERFVLGMDAGATKTECALGTVGGRGLAVVRGGPGNYELVGFEDAARLAAELMSSALAQAGARKEEITAACFALAGMDLPPDREIIRRRIVDPLGLSCP